MAQILKKNPIPLVISTQTPDTIIQAPQTSDIFTPSTTAFIQSLESIVAFIKETSHPSQSPPYPSESSRYDSQYDSEYYSEYVSEYDSDSDSEEYGSEYYSECDSECSYEEEQKAQQSSKKKFESIVTVDKEEGTSRKNGKKASENDLAVETLIRGVQKIYFDESAQSAPSKSIKGKEPASVANNSTHDTDSLTETSRFKDSNPLKSLDDSIHVFIDNSNILAGFIAYCNRQRRWRHGPKPRLNYDALFDILENGSNVARRVLVASSPLYQPLTQAEEAGYEVSILKRIGQKEQCVDEVIHLKILETLLDQNPSTLVLASGDGKDGEYFQGGFHKCVTKALERGWKVKVISWRRQLSQNFLNAKFLRQWKTSYQVIYLDRFALELGM